MASLDPDLEKVRRITGQTLMLAQELTRVGLAHWQAPVARLLNGYLALDEYAEADFAEAGLGCVLDELALLGPPLRDEDFADLLLASPLLGWSVKLAGRLWDPRSEPLEDFLGDHPDRGRLIVWQAPDGPHPTLDELRTWLLAEARRVRDGSGG